MNFSRTLKAILNERQLKQADLCRMTGIQTSLMSDYLNDKKSPAITNAILIADALGISLDTLVGKKNTAAPQPQNTSLQAEIFRQISSLPENDLLFLLDIVTSLKKYSSAKSEEKNSPF
jgi:transcriptional regulator with XRE-family HTH domain